jgi:hypothetical protein
MTWIIVSLVCNGMHCWWAPMKEKSFDSFRECEARAELIGKNTVMYLQLDCVAPSYGGPVLP